LRAGLEGGGSWLATHLLKDPTADAASIGAPLKTRLEQSPPTGGVERLVLEFTAFAPGTAELQLFARDAQAAARAGQQRALQSAAREIRMRVQRACLYHVIEVQPWSRLPRTPLRTDRLRAVNEPQPVTVEFEESGANDGRTV